MQANLDPNSRIAAAAVFADRPVIAWIDYPLLFLDRDAPLGSLKQPTSEDSRYLILRVDLDQSVDNLIPLITEELRQYSVKYRRGRLRLNQLRFHLQVFDLARGGGNLQGYFSETQAPDLHSEERLPGGQAKHLRQRCCPFQESAPAYSPGNRDSLPIVFKMQHGADF